MVTDGYFRRPIQVPGASSPGFGPGPGLLPDDPLTNLVQLIRHRGRVQRDKVVFTFLADGEIETASLTYGELDRRARTAGAELRRRGVTGQRALLIYPQGLEFIVALFAVLYAGAAAVPAPRAQINRASSARLGAIADDARPAIALTTAPLLAETRDLLSQRQEPLPVSSLEELLLAPDAEPDETGVAADSLALLQYTSGSTGVPRGVMVSHANILHNEELIRHHFEHTPDTVFVGWLPMFHDMGLIGNVLQPIYVGCTCYLMSPVAFLQDPGRWLRAISRYRGTTAGAPNFAYDLCVDRIDPAERAQLDLSSWDIAYNGSEPVRAATLHRFADAFAPYGFRREAFYPCYGMAEATLLIAGGAKAAAPMLRPLEHGPDHGHLEPRTVVSCGSTGLGQGLLVVDPESREPLPDGQVGEIWLSGDSVSLGYWNRPDDTRVSFGARLKHDDGRRFLRTGDLGFLHRGEVFVTGRIKEVIIVRGRNHYPQDIEATAQSSHPDLRPHCGAAFLVESAGREALVVAQEATRRFAQDPPVREIADAVRAAVAKEHGLHVAGVVVLKAGGIPKTTSGKIRRTQCRTWFLRGELSAWGEDLHGTSFWEEARSTPPAAGDAAARALPKQISQQQGGISA